jgi:hypothetical protein
MAVCIACGANTELYSNNIPISVRCSDAREREIQDRNQSFERANNSAMVAGANTGAPKQQNPMAESSERSTQAKE